MTAIKAAAIEMIKTVAVSMWLVNVCYEQMICFYIITDR